MSRSNLLILDANVVIHLHESGVWTNFIAKYDVHLPQAVVDEAGFYDDRDEERHYIDLSGDIGSGRVQVFEVELADVRTFSNKFDSVYVGKLDPGELEALAFLYHTSESYSISSGDAIVYRVLGCLNCGHQGISLEELLQQVGLQQSSVKWPYSKKFREQYTQVGAMDLIQGRGLKK